jgi:hypothetical protein
MNTSYRCCFAVRKMRSMFSTVLFSVTLWPTAPPGSAGLAQDVVLRIDEDHRGVVPVEFHDVLPPQAFRNAYGSALTRSL